MGVFMERASCVPLLGASHSALSAGRGGQCGALLGEGVGGSLISDSQPGKHMQTSAALAPLPCDVRGAPVLPQPASQTHF